MITLEDKLDTFYKIVYKAEEESSKLALEELENIQKEILEEKTDELQIKKEEKINRKRVQAISEKNEMISESIDRNRKRSLIKREELLENLIDSLELKAMNFTDTKEYESYLIDKIKENIKAMDEDNVILGVKAKDIDKIKAYIKSLKKETATNIELKEIDEIRIGGFKVWDKERNYTLDNTFKTIIEENRYQIGKKLYIALDRAGEDDE